MQYVPLDVLKSQLDLILNFVITNLSIRAKSDARFRSFLILLEITDRLQNDVPVVVDIFQQSFCFLPFLPDVPRETVLERCNSSSYLSFPTFFSIIHCSFFNHSLLDMPSPFVERNDDVTETETMRMLASFLHFMDKQESDVDFDWWYSLFIDSCGDTLFPSVFSEEDGDCLLDLICYLFLRLRFSLYLPSISIPALFTLLLSSTISPFQ